MSEFEFTIHVKSIPNDDLETWTNQLWDNGCQDSSPGISCGRPSVHFCREADSLEAAMKSALELVRSTGVEVERIELDGDALELLTAGTADA